MAETTETTTEETTTTETETSPAPEERKLSQAEVDRIVEARLARERKKFEGHEDALEKARKFDELQEAQKSEIERAQNAAQEAAARAEKAEAAASTLRVRTALLQAAANPAHKVVDPEGAVEFLLGADADLVKLNDEGVPENLDDAIGSLLERRSYLVAKATETTPKTSADQGARGGPAVGQLTEADLHTMTPAEIVQARSEGRLTKLLGGGS